MRILLALTLLAIPAAAQNIALNVPCSFEPAPNYEHCTDPADTAQLTDGQYVSGYFWTQPGTVGWAGRGIVVITIDLATDKPVSGLSLSTAAGVAGVEWPQSISILTAGDDNLYHYAGDLVALGAQNGAPPADGYATHKFQTNALRTHGRKIALVVKGEPFIFCDEIEVIKGDDAWLADPLPGQGAPDVALWMKNLLTLDGVKRRISRDAESVRAAAAEGMPDVVAGLDAVTADLNSLPVEYGPEFKTILPLNPLHDRVFDALAAVWRAKGLTGLKTWPAGPWDALDLTPALPGPAPDAPAAVELHMMLNEFRAAAINVATPDPCSKLDVAVVGLPGGDNPPYVEVREVAWTDTRTGVPVAAALLPAPLDAGSYSISIRPGLVRQIWLTFNPRDVQPGVYEGAVRINGQPVPLRLNIYPIRFPDKPALHFGGWDYTNAEAHYEVTADNKPALVQHLRDHFVDSPWATPAAMPQGKHDDTGAMIAPPDTANFDAWLKLWPGAARYCVFAAVSGSFQKWPMATPEFDRAVAGWANFWAGKMRENNLDPAQLMVLLFDEPSEPDHDAIIAAWARAVRASGAGIKVWEDPIHKTHEEASKEMLDLCDVLCPNRSKFLMGGDEYRASFLNRPQGQALEFYSCSGPMRGYDPYTYCRLQAWDCFRYGAGASYFWAFADGAGGSSWNEYPQPRTAYTPLFIDPKGVTPGKHLEACREGIEDYEYLLMLQKAAESGAASEQARATARQLLTDLPETIGTKTVNFNWKQPTGLPTPADQARIQILDALQSLK